jgi:hypothetical protein
MLLNLQALQVKNKPPDTINVFTCKARQLLLLLLLPNSAKKKRKVK